MNKMSEGKRVRHNDKNYCFHLPSIMFFFWKVGLKGEGLGLHALTFLLQRQYVLPHQNLAFLSLRQAEPLWL